MAFDLIKRWLRRHEPLVADDSLPKLPPSEHVSTREVHSNMDHIPALVDSLKQLRATIRETEKSLAVEFDEEIAAAERKIEYAERLVKDTGLWRTVLHFVDWPIVIEALGMRTRTDKSSTVKNADVTRSDFLYLTDSYSFELERYYYGTDDNFADLRVLYNDLLVFQVRLNGEYDGNDSIVWNMWGVDTLKIGPWIGRLVELEPVHELVESGESVVIQRGFHEGGRACGTPRVAPVIVEVGGVTRAT